MRQVSIQQQILAQQKSVLTSLQGYHHHQGALSQWGGGLGVDVVEMGIKRMEFYK